MKKILLNVALALLAATSAFSADTKISALPDGSPAVATDRIPIARGAANFYIPFSAAWQVPSGSQFRGPDGSAAVPSFSFTSDTNTGIYLAGADFLALAVGGAAPVAISTTQVVTTIAFRGPDGSAVAPTYSFSGAQTTGMYRVSGNFPSFAGNGVWQGTFENGVKIASTGTYQFLAGTAPTNSPDTGLARSAAGVVKITDGSTGFGRLTLADGTAATNCAILFQNGGCIVSSGTPAITIGTATVGFAQFQSTVLRIASGAQFQWSSGAIHAAGADSGFARVAAAQIRTSDGAAGIGAFQYASTVTAVTGTGQALVNTDSGKWFTNTGDADGSSFNLPDDPGVRGLRYGFCVTTAQTVTINAGSGETIVDDGTSGTSIASSDDGACMELMAVINGSGGRWQVLSKTGTWTIS